MNNAIIATCLLLAAVSASAQTMSGLEARVTEDFAAMLSYYTRAGSASRRVA